MIEKTIFDYIKQTITEVPIYMEEPEHPPASYITVRRTGRDIDDQIQQATIAILSYGGSMYDAAMLDERVVAAMLAMAPDDGVFSVDLNTDYEYTNLETKQYRYQAIFDVSY